jgi:hypothetical protein
MRGSLFVGYACLAIAACGGGDKKPVEKPKAVDRKPPPPKQETEEGRAAKRLASAQKLIPEGTDCLPAMLKEDDAPRLELGATGADALVCAMDNDTDRMLGPIACWKIDLASGGLAYREPSPLPGRGFAVALDGKDGRCARGYCLPRDAKVDNKRGHIAWALEGKKVAVVVDDDVHLFDAESKDHESSFTIRGDKGVTNDPRNVFFVGESLVVEGYDDGPYAAAWVFKTDGTQVGPVSALGGKEEKPISTFKGSVSVLDKGNIGVAERGMETLTTYELETGKRTKLVRKVAKPACKPAEIDAFWREGDKVSDKCRDSILKASGHLIGASAVKGATNFLVLLKGSRLGELGVLDAKNLLEKKAIKMQWCPAEAADQGGSDD